jgi:hypothetical protein
MFCSHRNVSGGSRGRGDNRASGKVPTNWTKTKVVGKKICQYYVDKKDWIPLIVLNWLFLMRFGRNL